MNVRIGSVRDGRGITVSSQMPPTQVLIHGNAKQGTPLMLPASSVALDLPLRVLLRDDCQGSTRASFHTAEELESAHPLPAAPLRAGACDAAADS